MEFLNHKKHILSTGIFLLFFFGLVIFFPFSAKAANVGDIVDFDVDKNFDANNRTQVTSVLVQIGARLYFYIEKTWWDSQVPAKQAEVLLDLGNLSNEFDNNIYPTLTSIFGQEWSPGIDSDPRISVLFESMNSAEGGYFRETDGYEKIQLPDSNQREMLYLSVSNITDPNLKIVLGHEFVHLITFNQKNRIFGVEEETWLNEGRADYSSSILRYDNNYEQSNLQQRVKDFVDNPSDSLLGWQGTKYDYASVSMFMHYLVDHFGVNILSDSLKSKYIGIDSINYALQKNGFKDDFSQIFTNWTVALLLNDCSGGTEYCYLNQSLKNFKLLPSLNFLPLTGNVSLSVSNITENWSGNWIKFIGGKGDLKVNFSSLVGLDFRVPYIIQDSVGSYVVDSFALNKEEKGEINIPKFGTDYKTLIIIPSLQSAKLSFESDQTEPSYPYTYAIYITGSAAVKNQDLIQQLLDRIAALKQEIANLQAQKSNIGSISTLTQGSCLQFNLNLYFGMSNDDDVRCLQNFLKNQGPDIYPEGLVTGNFANLTKAAVIRFQEKYTLDILTPIGLLNGTGYVGERTRAKINQILSSL